ncbi:hypothetical protein [Helicobacter sp. 11S02596-1]|uniref:hypothetical protein n=1 Tax=Helicobacter sp. 11S02596-1 TaxID=1476194 RepID=UPI000BA6A16A|nr:hypothetical protein [Helicobacter sp. 11S02596-1]PAF44527.1 hypothetical protein BJI48_03135 [Helicobacter sp. 11S02596-1]
MKKFFLLVLVVCLGAKEYYPIGPSVTGAAAGSTVAKGTIILQLESVSAKIKNNQAGIDVQKEVFIPKIRVGLGEGWDVRWQTPFLFNTIYQAPRNKSVRGPTDSLLLFHKQFVLETEGYFLGIGTDYIVSIPTDGSLATGNGAFGAGIGLGASWRFQSMGVDFDMAVIGYARGRLYEESPWFYIKTRYAYALSRYFDVGAELNWDYRNDYYASNLKQGYHTLYIGPMVGLKVPSWKNFSIGLVTYYAAYEKYNVEIPSGEKTERFRFVVRANLFF